MLLHMPSPPPFLRKEEGVLLHTPSYHEPHCFARDHMAPLVLKNQYNP